MSISTSVFGTYLNEEIKLYTLKNKHGMEVSISNYGATITKLIVPDKNGTPENIACGFDNLQGYFSEEYLANAPYFGCTVGRYSSQIKDAKFTLNGKEYQLNANNGDNNLHGGSIGFDKRIWQAQLIDTDDSSIKMTLISKDLEEGFPGNVEVTVRFSLSDNNELSIDYMALSDQDTPLSMTNHTYFNLDAFSSNVENHQAVVHTTKRQVMDETGAGTGEVISIAGEADDLTQGKRIGDAHTAMNGGFENFYIFDNSNFDIMEVAKISSETSGRTLSVSTTEPCMLLYTGKYTSDELKRENGEQYGKYRGFCCETHRFQNGPNIPWSPKSITKSGELFKSTTVFKFTW